MQILASCYKMNMTNLYFSKKISDFIFTEHDINLLMFESICSMQWKSSLPGKHLHTLRPQIGVHHPHQAFQDLQGKHQDLTSRVLLPYLFVEH